MVAAAVTLVLPGCGEPVDDSSGPVLNRADWPWALNEVAESVDLTASEEVGVRVHCFYDSIDSAHAWQHASLPRLCEAAISRFKLTATTVENPEVKAVLKAVPEGWASPIQSDDVRCYVRKPFEDGNDGSRCVLVHDEAEDLVTVWFQFVF